MVTGFRINMTHDTDIGRKREMSIVDLNSTENIGSPPREPPFKGSLEP